MISNKLTTLSFIVFSMMTLLLAQVRATYGLDICVNDGTNTCIKKCAIKCLPLLFPPRIVTCSALCILACKLIPPAIVMDCTID
ncbi:hypothetical protein GQ457_14G013420 [Hibiscus cannabinus]